MADERRTEEPAIFQAPRPHPHSRSHRRAHPIVGEQARESNRLPGRTRLQKRVAEGDSLSPGSLGVRKY